MNDTALQSQDKRAQEMLLELADLPGEIRYRLARHTCSPDVIEHVAAGIRQALDELTVDSSEDELRAVATHLRAQVELGLHILTALGGFAGEIEGLGWASRLREIAGRTDGS